MAVVGYFNPNRDTITQLDAFNQWQCSHIYHSERDLLENAAEGDVVILVDLSCAGRTLEESLAFLHRLHEHGLQFVCAGDDLDSRSSDDVMRVLEAIYKMVQVEARDKRAAAKAEGDSDEPKPHRGGGRGRVPIDEATIDEALKRYESGDTVRVICEELGLSQGTLYRYARERGVSRSK